MSLGNVIQACRISAEITQAADDKSAAFERNRVEADFIS